MSHIHEVCFFSSFQSLGETKIASMVESKDFRKSIIQLEWEYKKMMMEMEDLQNKMRDIQNLKVTRMIQGVCQTILSNSHLRLSFTLEEYSITSINDQHVNWGKIS